MELDQIASQVEHLTRLVSSIDNKQNETNRILNEISRMLMEILRAIQSLRW